LDILIKKRDIYFLLNENIINHLNINLQRTIGPNSSSSSSPSSSSSHFQQTTSDSFLFHHQHQQSNQQQRANSTNQSKVGKVIPCLQTLLFTMQRLPLTLSWFCEANKRMQTLINAQLAFVYRDEIFRVAAVLDPSHGTTFAPSNIHKKQLEHCVIESLTRADTFSATTPMFWSPSSKYKYVCFDESFVDDQKQAVFRDELASYLKQIRSVIGHHQSNSSSSNKLFSSGHYGELEPVRFWIMHGKKWPHLARLVKRVWTVRASNWDGVERVLEIDKYRQALSNHPDAHILSEILFLKCNQNLN
jgi:hypothetical protein